MFGIVFWWLKPSGEDCDTLDCDKQAEFIFEQFGLQTWQCRNCWVESLFMIESEADLAIEVKQPQLKGA